MTDLHIAAKTAAPEVAAPAIKIAARGLNFWYDKFHAVRNINLDIPEKRVTALIGPSGCGKSTLLRVFPMTIYENVAYGIRHHERLSRSQLDDRVEQALRQAALWDEVKDKLKASGLGLSGGQQQRLCIARAIALRPEVLLLDEPTSALDPISTGRIEQLVEELKQQFTIMIVTHNMQQAARVSDYTAFMYLGDLVEYGPTAQIFSTPAKQQTEDYITGRFG